MILLGKQIQTSLRLISVSLSNVLYCIYDVSVVSRCTLYLNKILFTLTLLSQMNLPDFIKWTRNFRLHGCWVLFFIIIQILIDHPVSKH